MALNYTPYPNGAKLEFVRNTLNNFNDSVVLEVNNLTHTVNNIDTRVTTNEGDLLQAKLDILALQSGAYYEYEKYQNIIVPSDTYNVVGALARNDVPDGVYEVKFALTYTLDSVTHSAYIRYSLDGGTTWYEFRREPKDKTDRTAIYYAFPIDVTGPDIHIIVEAKKEDSGDSFEIQFLDIILDRKK